MAEVAALQAARRQALGRGFDGVLLVPAFLEAGRLTAGGIHWARVGGELVPVGETEFARDARVRLPASDLKDFISEKSGGRIGRGEVASISLADIQARRPGPGRRPAGRAAGRGLGRGQRHRVLRPRGGGLRRAAGRAGRPVVPVPHRALVRAGPGRPGPDGAAARPGHLARAAAPPRARPDRGRIPRRPDQPAARRAARAPRHRRRRTRRGRRHRAARIRSRPRRREQVADGAEPVRCPAVHQPHPGPRPRCRRWPGHRPHGVRGPVADRPPRAGRRARLGHRQGRDHLPRRGPVRPGHPPRRGGGPAVPRHGLAAAPHRCRGPRGRHALCRLRRQRRRRPGPGRRGGHPQRGLTVRLRRGRPPRYPCPGG